ncbi:hypothetical protein C1E23_11455 [Pseudoalteromonas phenolica]|uniref:Uncharacterized protein n=1 Tax=Pseudoalteromonas phenolica TaxID=161398 RepID=A0A4Q7IN45_9GAMM|nr:hypothetical protein [Pseudoalteromonas phenolica]RZQ52969.1 hypothetical protein C1E23_11455 [Pseudoalteromonas phenolica]
MFRLFCFLFISPLVFAEQKLFEKSADCSVFKDKEQLLVRASSKRLRIEWEELKDDVASKVLTRAFEKLETLDSDYQLRKLFFEKKIEQIKNREVKVIEARLVLNPVKDCKRLSKTIARGEAHKLNNLELNIKSNFKLQVTSPAELLERTLKLNNTNISHEEVFGVKFGQSFKSVEDQFGRFSLVWPMGKDKLALVGRNHAFYFENDFFSGYSYGRSLLPMSIRNRVEIISDDISLEVKGHNDIKIEDGISDSELNLLRQNFHDFKVLLVGDALNEETFLRVESFTVGKINFDLSQSALNCIIANDVNQLPNLGSHSLITFYDKNGKRNLLSGCNQQFTLSARGQLRTIELLEPWSVKNSLLFEDEPFSPFSGWQLFGLEQGATLERLKKLGKIDVFLDMVEFSSMDGAWSGRFYIDNDKLVSGEVDIFAL